VDVSLDLSGRRVLVVGDARSARRAVARYLAAGAAVSLVSAHDTPDSAVRPVGLPDSPEKWRDLVTAVDLVVLVVGASPDLDRVISAVCAENRVWLTREKAAATARTGHVTLAGGGPGDDCLRTVAALAALGDADVVYFDRLGPHDRLNEWAPGAEHINVGKTPGHHAYPQAEIERMLIESARAGRSVVRLKGGDPFVFGRGGEEIIACRDAGVPVTVLSGVTSAISVPAAAGIPVTRRDVSRIFTVVSGHAPLDADELAHLAGLGGTIVVLMGIGTLPHLIAGLTRNGMAADMPVAIIERGFSTNQRTTLARVDTVVSTAGGLGVRSPAVIVIGEVVRLSHSGAAVRLLHAAVTPTEADNLNPL
jgi:uroporphyrin-III C-methyltransferase